MKRDDSLRLWPTLLAALLPLGCPADDGSSDDETGPTILAGDLVISEIMADPDGSDEGLEWFEIYNATSSAIDLEGFSLVYSKADGTGRKTHAIAGSLTIEPGDYLVVGGVLPEIAAQSDTDHLDYGYGGDLGAFVGSAGYLAIELDEEVIDEVYYAEVTSGASRTFDGVSPPSAVTNDDLDRWCDSRTEFDGPTFLATPGMANELCTQGDTCDGRPIVPPGPGAFVITEVHANPGVLGDDGEWFEIHALTDFDLNGLELGRDLAELELLPFEQKILEPACVAVESGEYVVFAHDVDPAVNGIPDDARIEWLDPSVQLTIDGALWLRAPSEADVPGMAIDAVTWSADDGVATQLDPDFEDAAANDNLGNWCPATLPYGAGDLGSPGSANEECAIEVPEGMCIDPDTRELRAIEPIAQGDLVITEFFASPLGEDGPAEWFEAAAIGAGDLNGMWVGNDGEWNDEIVSDLCIEVVADDYILFAHEPDPLLNGGLPPVDAVFVMALPNSASNLAIGYDSVADGVIDDPAELWDGITWASTTEAISNNYGGPLDTVLNDDLELWCDGKPSTPRAANPSCTGCTDPDTNMERSVIAPMVGDLRLTEVMPDPDGGGAVTDATGEWFEIHTTAAFDLNGLQIGKDADVKYEVEDPDGLCIEVDADTWLVFTVQAENPDNCLDGVSTFDYDGLSLTNDPGNMFVGHGGAVLDQYDWLSSPTGASLSLDLMSNMWCSGVAAYGCGDLGSPGGPNPACGGMMGDTCVDPDDMSDRVPVAPVLGDLIITEFMADPAAPVTDADGEWFEVRALANVDLNGLELADVPFIEGGVDLTLTSNDCLEIAAGETRLFASNSDSMVNGGLPQVDFEFGFGLSNDNVAGIYLYIGHGGVLLDEIHWTASATGSSTSLDPDFYDPLVNDIADDSDIAWCYGAGTPKVDNGQCG